MQVVGDAIRFTIILLNKSSFVTSWLRVETKFYLTVGLGLKEPGSNRTLHCVQRQILGFIVGFSWPLGLSL